jgi:hypothetical protein
VASIMSVRVGDVIVERNGSKKSMIPVKSISYKSCSSMGVHVNNNACYDSTAVVEIIQEDADISFEESALGDVMNDFEIWAEEIVGEVNKDVLGSNDLKLLDFNS